jgi:acyl-CoA thioesterase-1
VQHRSGSSASARPLAALLIALAAGCGSSSDGGGDERDGFEGRLDGPASILDDPGATEVAIPDDAPTVVFLGDSIGAGLHLAEHQAFPALLQREHAADGVPFRLVNASKSGRTTSGGVTALDWVLRTAPDVVVIELGGNDGLRGTPLGTVEANLRTLIERTRDSGARVLLLGVRLPANYGSYAERFDALYPKLADEYEIAFVPYFMEDVGAVPEMNLDDGLHPTPEGHRRLADTVAPVLAEVLGDLDES